jgi:hypothetical protein
VSVWVRVKFGRNAARVQTSDFESDAAWVDFAHFHSPALKCSFIGNTIKWAVTQMRPNTLENSIGVTKWLTKSDLNKIAPESSV